MALVSLRAEVTELLRELVRIDTVNPPGNETRAAEHLRAFLERDGVECRLFSRVEQRANLVARIPGRDPDAPRLLLLSHTDTVLADPAEWAVDPWSGALRDGHVWGRGALDMKGQVAASAVALAALAREGFEPSGDVIFVASADEEVGEGFGLSWLVEAHAEAVRATWCVNEGGGDRVVADGRPLYLCSAAEKATSPFVIRIRGTSGHASTPGVADNALLAAGLILERLAALETPLSMGAEARVFFEAIMGPVDDAADALSRLRERSARAAAINEPMLRATVAPTQIRASDQRNVIPALCEIVCDCRLLPGQTQADLEPVIRRALGESGYEIEWLERTGGSRSSLHTPLWEAIESFVESEEENAALVPILMPGFTDSHFLRETFGTVVYGFFPMRAMGPELAASLVHSADERASVDDLELGTRFLIHVVRELQS
jgi:acetylornithine deacetylase/succinyl-diaminopimelate desuccinylase-like protein